MHSILLSLGLVALSLHVSAITTIHITPTLATETQVQQALATETKRSENIVEGAGGTLRFDYASSHPLTVFVTPFNSETTFNPADMLGFTLPPGQRQIADVDLTRHAAWKPWPNKYQIVLVSAATETDAVFHEVTVEQASIAEILRAMLTHIFEPEPFRVSSIHVLLGYRVLGLPILPVIGLSALLLLLILVLRRASHRTILSTVAVISLLYSARVAADLSRWSIDHLREWNTRHTYSLADDLHAVAAFLIAENRKHPGTVQRIAICHDTTNYYPKLLRYLLYPIPVATEEGTGLVPSHVVVAKKVEWSFDRGVLSCGGRTAPARLLSEFEAGAKLFALSAS